MVLFNFSIYIYLFLTYSLRILKLAKYGTTELAELTNEIVRLKDAKNTRTL